MSAYDRSGIFPLYRHHGKKLQGIEKKEKKKKKMIKISKDNKLVVLSLLKLKVDKFFL